MLNAENDESNDEEVSPGKQKRCGFVYDVAGDKEIDLKQAVPNERKENQNICCKERGRVNREEIEADCREENRLTRSIDLQGHDRTCPKDQVFDLPSRQARRGAKCLFEIHQDHDQSDEEEEKKGIADTPHRKVGYRKVCMSDIKKKGRPEQT